MKRQGSFFFSQKRNDFDKTSSAITNMSSYLLHSIFKTEILEYCRRYLFEKFSFLPFDLKQCFEEPNNSTRRFTRYILFDVNHKQYVEADRRQLRWKISSHHSFHKNQHLKYQRVPNRFFGIRDWAYLKAGIREF